MVWFLVCSVLTCLQFVCREKKKAVIVGDASAAGDEKYIAKDHFVPKTPGEINSIADAVKNNFLFQHLKVEQVRSSPDH